ncbi:MAG: 1-(5-phosphoribosyl)-5-amino-4-imidazole-carboxylate carboxylase, partial [Saccharothrix sp.]|nr:1-(5-phosphoribosyl)-5-amino-4-imidazole-carboxylate carboxylase [Saccharothrix sp.]
MTDELDLGYARLDLAREARQGLPEVVYGPGKTVEQVCGIVTALLAHNNGPVLVTRVTPDTAAAVLAATPGGTHDPEARLLVWRPAATTGFRVV